MDLALDISLLDGADRTAAGIDLADVDVGCSLQLVRQMLDVVGAGEGIDGVGDARLCREHLLRAECQGR